ncbi:MAG TPA: hypothetical protein VIL55_07090 [Naasia sp.]
MRRIWGIVLAGMLLLAGCATLPAPDPQPTGRTGVDWRTADSGDFRPGLLVSDALFYDSGSVGVEDLQRFLRSRACLPVDDVPCLADYRESTPDKADVGPGHCAAYHGGTRQTAAQIFVGAGRACGIDPRVLVVLVQKEQSLVSRPSADGYTRATGYACPDTADCDTRYFGFFNQVYNAAWQFRQYTLHPDERRFEVGTVDVPFSPDGACGSAPVEIRNQATANLYNYTPYQPNQAAIDDLYGDGDGCSAYGNRNFWRIWTDWFGDPTSPRFPVWLGSCLRQEGGERCLDSYWLVPPPR